MIASQLKIGKKIYVCPNINNSLIENHEFVSQVEDVINENEFVISLPLYKSNTLRLNVGDRIKITFTHDHGLYVFEGETVKEIVEGDLLLYRIRVISEIQRIQRREYFRVTTNVPIVYQYVSHSGEVYGQGITKDLSGGGVKFVCSEKLHVGDIINIYINFEEEIEINTMGKVIRCDKTEAEKYEVSLNFINLDFAQRESLIKYIFKIQRENLRKIKE